MPTSERRVAHSCTMVVPVKTMHTVEFLAANRIISFPIPTFAPYSNQDIYLHI